MDRGELAWRVAERAWIAAHRMGTRVAPPRWRRRALADRLAPHDPLVAGAVQALRRNDWAAAHGSLGLHFANRSPRFIVHPGARERVRSEVLERHPEALTSAIDRADRIIAGSYDLLGYEDLHFETDGSLDWHLDPVSNRRAPKRFWADVPYLQKAVGDHKVIWELNRHQEWLLLGRAFWLTGEARYRRAFVRQLESWLEANPPDTGINWASALELALRSISWLWALELFTTPAQADETPWIVDLLLGVDRQLRHVERRLSRFFSPNTHLLGEALALYVCGRALPELSRSARWTEVGRDVLLAETTRQVLPDGVHAERSTHYHRYTLDFYLMALSVARITGDRGVAERLQPVAHALADFMRDVSDVSGRYPLIGDDDGGELAPVTGRTCGDARVSLGWAGALLKRRDLAPDTEPEAVCWLTAVAGPAVADAADTPRAEPRPPATYPTAGYFISRHGRSHLVFDAGRHGFLNGGHAHADALAVTLVADGQPLLADGGTATYTMDSRLRDYFRSSQAHNTVTIDGRSQSQPLGAFHWRSTADAVPRRIAQNPHFDYFEGITDAYAPLIHERRILSLDDHRWVVSDRITDGGRSTGYRRGETGNGVRRAGHMIRETTAHEATLYWHLHPEWIVTADGSGGAQLSTASGRRARMNVLGARVEVVPGGSREDAGWLSPVYGRTVPAATLRCRVIHPPPIAMATLIESGVDRPLTARLLDVLTTETRDGALGIMGEDAEGLALTLFGSRAGETQTMILDPRRALTISTDARMLHARLGPDGHLERLCAVDCTIVRFEGAHTVTLLAAEALRDIDVLMGRAGAHRMSSSTRLPDVQISVEANDSTPARSVTPDALAPDFGTTRELVTPNVSSARK